MGAFARLLSLLSPQSPESPPPSQAQNRKEGSRGCPFRRTARRPPPPPAGSLPPLSESTSFPLSPKSSSWWAGGKISLETSCQPPVALEEVISQEKQASGFHEVVNKQSIPEAEGRQGGRASFPPSPSLSRPINFPAGLGPERMPAPLPHPSHSGPFSFPFLPSSL